MNSESNKTGIIQAIKQSVGDASQEDAFGMPPDDLASIVLGGPNSSVSISGSGINVNTRRISVGAASVSQHNHTTAVNPMGPVGPTGIPGPVGHIGPLSPNNQLSGQLYPNGVYQPNHQHAIWTGGGQHSHGWGLQPGTMPYDVFGPDVDAYKLVRDAQYPKDLLISGKPFVTALSGCSRYAFIQIVATWITTTDPDSTKYGILWEPAKLSALPDDGYLVIEDGALFRSFKTWLKKYITRFHGENWKRDPYPAFVEGERMGGYSIRRSENISYTYEPYTLVHQGSDPVSIQNYKGAFEDWCWIVENTSGKVLLMGHFWIFEDQSEMIMYKLKQE